MTPQVISNISNKFYKPCYVSYKEIWIKDVIYQKMVA